MHAALTKIPSGASAFDIACLTARDTVVGIDFAAGCFTPMRVMLTIRPPPRARIEGDHETAIPHRREQLQVEVGLPGLVGHRLERADLGGARVVHQDVDAAVGRDRVGD